MSDKDLRDKIKEHSDLFDAAEPARDHFERFEKKLNNYHRQNRKIRLYPFLRAASILILVILSGLWVYEHTFGMQHGHSKGTSLSDISGEYAEVEAFYNTTIHQKMESLGQYQKCVNINELQQQFNELDHTYNELQKELEQYPQNEQIINEMIQYYKVKVDILNRILNNIRQNERNKNNCNEKIEI